MSGRVALEGRQILIGGKPCFLRSAEIHYFRLPRGEWAERVKAAREGGLNCIASYIPWQWHEPEEGLFDFSAASVPERDLAAFLSLVKDAGLYFFARIGPFVNAELSRGGHPLWLYDKHPEVRSKDASGAFAMRRGDGEFVPSQLDPRYLDLVSRWYGRVIAGAASLWRRQRRAHHPDAGGQRAEPGLQLQRRRLALRPARARGGRPLGQVARPRRSGAAEKRPGDDAPGGPPRRRLAALQEGTRLRVHPPAGRGRQETRPRPSLYHERADQQRLGLEIGRPRLLCPLFQGHGPADVQQRPLLPALRRRAEPQRRSRHAGAHRSGQDVDPRGAPFDLRDRLLVHGPLGRPRVLQLGHHDQAADRLGHERLLGLRLQRRQAAAGLREDRRVLRLAHGHRSRRPAQRAL